MEQLSGLDASFLALETERAPMHIAGLSILDPRRAGEGGDDGEPLDFTRFRAFVASRLDASRTFRQRLAEVPLDLGRPYWVEDADFDLDRHLERTTLPEPGGWRELCALMAWELSRPLPRDRPLWQMLFVEKLDAIPGVPRGAVAVIGKVHHAAIDGVSGAEILSALFDATPTPAPRASQPAAKPDATAPLEREQPSGLELLRRSGVAWWRRPGVRRLVSDAVKGAARSGTVWGLRRVKLPPMPFSAPRCMLNAPISKDHAWAGAVLDLARLQAVRAKARRDHGLEATLNDVVLTVCAGALRRYLRDRGDLPEKPLVAMVPISVRAREQRGTMGNQVSAMLVQLATDEDDPLRRLARIHDGAARAKTHHQAIGARTLTDSTQVVPFALSGIAARLYSRMELAERHRPIFNLVITNVPGPQVPLFVDGAPLLHHLGAAPIFDGMGLLLAVFSYHGQLAIGACTCRKIMPDVDDFAAGLEAALDELEAAVAA